MHKRKNKHIETKITRGEEHSKLPSFKLDALVASHFMLLPDLMYIKYSCSRNGSLIKIFFEWQRKTFQ